MVYSLPQLVSPADLALMRKIDALRLEHPFMGARMLRDQQARQGVRAGRRYIRTLMLRMGIEALAPQSGTSKAAPLATGSTRTCCASGRSTAPTRSERWIPLYPHGARFRLSHRRGGRGPSHSVLAHKVAITLEAVHAKEVIEQAFARHGTPEIVNTDQGSPFTAVEFTDAVLAQGCKLSMDGRGAWRDNVFLERVWRSVKYERVYLKAYQGVSMARADIADYLGLVQHASPAFEPGAAYAAGSSP